MSQTIEVLSFLLQNAQRLHFEYQQCDAAHVPGPKEIMERKALAATEAFVSHFDQCIALGYNLHRTLVAAAQERVDVVRSILDTHVKLNAGDDCNCLDRRSALIHAEWYAEFATMPIKNSTNIFALVNTLNGIGWDVEDFTEDDARLFVQSLKDLHDWLKAGIKDTRQIFTEAWRDEDRLEDAIEQLEVGRRKKRTRSPIHHSFQHAKRHRTTAFPRTPPQKFVDPTTPPAAPRQRRHKPRPRLRNVPDQRVCGIVSVLLDGSRSVNVTIPSAYEGAFSFAIPSNIDAGKDSRFRFGRAIAREWDTSDDSSNGTVIESDGP